VKYLTDANVLSEAMKPAPSSKVMEWLRTNEADIVVDPIILGEMRFGILLLPASKRKRSLERWFAEVITRLTCLTWTADTGLFWAQLLSDLRKQGLVMPIKDSMIAATAVVHHLTVATRNVKDFQKAKVIVFDPFA